MVSSSRQCEEPRLDRASEAESGSDVDLPAESGSMALIDHLIELQRRLIWSLAAFGLAFIICYEYAEYIFRFLVQPLAEEMGRRGVEEGARHRLIYTGLGEAFFTYLKVAAFSAFFVAFPIIAVQIWMFIAPALYKNERRAFLPFLFATPLLFLLGAALLYFMVMPILVWFFLGFEVPGDVGTMAIELEPRVSEYFALVTQLILAFGIAFQLPVLLTLLAKVGLLRSESLVTRRRYAILFIFIAAALLTPPDPLSQVMLSVPLILLYELSIFSCRWVEPSDSA